MNIGMVVDGRYPSDIRVRKEAESLSKNHSVFVLCIRNKTEKIFESIDDIQIYRPISYPNVVIKGVIDGITSLFFIHPLFSIALKKFVKKYKIEALHVHDLPLAKTVYKTAKQRNISTVLDLHENYPEGLKVWFSWKRNIFMKWKNKVFFNYKKWHNYEKKMVHLFDVIITVVDEMKERIIKEHNLAESKIAVITNSEKKDFVHFYTQKKPLLFSNKTPFIISYVGGFGPHRGLHTAILGMKKIVKIIPNVSLFIVGPASKYVRNYLTKMVIKENLENNVFIKNAIPFNEVIEVMKNSHINIIPHESNGHTENTIPHKLYQILLSKQPILVSDCKPLVDIIGKNDIGTIFKAGSANSFAEKVTEIYQNYNTAQVKADKGYSLATQGNLNWEYTEKALLKVYNTFLKEDNREIN